MYIIFSEIIITYSMFLFKSVKQRFFLFLKKGLNNQNLIMIGKECVKEVDLG